MAKKKTVTVKTKATTKRVAASVPRVKAKLSKHDQLLRDYDDVLTKNKKLFKAGCMISRKDLVTLFGVQGDVTTGSYKRQHKANLRLVRVQNTINYLMRANGLYLKSKDYYSEFHVCQKDQTKSVIVRYAAGVDTQDSCEVQLDTGMITRLNAGTWGTYNRVYHGNKATNPAPAPKGQEARAINRVKHYP